jgi:PIN domain nuclease of toxin-antitoxin system
MKALLDTHILLFWFENERRLTRSQRRILASATAEDPLFVCDISLWEICTLYELRRIEISIPLREWLERATAQPLVHVCPITPAVASEVASLPSTFHRDPADRIILSTARVYDLPLVTLDDRIISSKLCRTA